MVFSKLFDEQQTEFTISSLLSIRARKFTAATACLIFFAFLAAQFFIYNAALTRTKTAAESWIELNKERIEQALFLENALAIRGLLAESSGVRLGSQQEIVGVEVRDNRDRAIAAVGDFKHDTLNPLLNVIQTAISGKIKTVVPLVFVDRPQGILTIYSAMDRSSFTQSALSVLVMTLIFAFLINRLASALIRELRVGVLDPLSRITSSISSTHSSAQYLSSISLPEGMRTKATLEIKSLVETHNALMGEIRSLNNRERAQAELISKATVATQVSHDIRSPLSALKTVLAVTSGLRSDERELFRASIDRINSIANNLLANSRLAPLELGTSSFDLVGAVRIILKEKEFEFENVSIELKTSDNYIDVCGNSDQFKTVVSNLLNNSIESLSVGGSVSINISIEDGDATLQIRDSGDGIPEEILNILGKSPVTYGKARGNGIGVFSSIKTIESFGGRIEIDSALGVGTTVNIYLRQTFDDFSFSASMLSRYNQIVIVDDDDTVSAAWKLVVDGKVDFLVSASPEEFRVKFHSGAYEPDAFFLIDNNFVNSTESGLDLINRLQLHKRSILVTSDADNPKVRNSARVSRIRIMSKANIGSTEDFKA